MDDLKVTIVGAGIGGLTTGIALKQAGYEVDIYERTRELRPAGAGISLWSNGIKVLNRLGLGEKVAALGGRMDRMEYRSHRDESLSQIDLSPLVTRVGQRPYPVARTDLQTLLLEAFGRDRVHLGCRCVGVDQDEHSVTAYFENGDRIRSDLLVAADGVRSSLRADVIGREQGPRYADYVNWNGLVPMSPDLCDPDNWVIYVGEGKRASMMPVGGDRFYFFFGCPMAAGTVVPPEERRQELSQIFAGWPQAVQTLIQQIDPLQTNRLEIVDLEPLSTLVRGRVALLGDAAHGTTPTLGQGGCQAIEDAEVLCRYLVSTSIGVADALQRYEQARRDRVAEITLKARKRADTIYGKDMQITAAWYDQLRQEPPDAVVNALAKVILAGPLQ